MKTKEQKSHAFNKVVKTITTCKNFEHIVATRKMITNYFNMFKTQYPDVKYDVMVLNEELDEKEIELSKN